jgi:hypothetical protein
MVLKEILSWIFDHFFFDDQIEIFHFFLDTFVVFNFKFDYLIDYILLLFYHCFFSFITDMIAFWPMITGDCDEYLLLLWLLFLEPEPVTVCDVLSGLALNLMLVWTLDFTSLFKPNLNTNPTDNNSIHKGTEFILWQEGVQTSNAVCVNTTVIFRSIK